LTGYTITNAMIYSTAILITALNVIITEVLISKIFFVFFKLF